MSDKPAPKSLNLARFKMRQLLLLVALQEKGSILKAAEAAGVSQPAASKLLSELEDTLGVALFERHARGVVPTWYGEILARRARNALWEVQSAHDEVLTLRSGLSGEASIGTIVTSTTNLVPTAIAALKRKSPRILITADMDHSEPLVRRLVAGELDIVIARTQGVSGLKEIEFETLPDEPHRVYARAGHPLVRKRGLALADLAEQTWVLPPPGNPLRERLHQIFLQGGLKLPDQVVETPVLPLTTNLLKLSDMVSAMGTEVVRPYVEAKVLAALPIKLDLRLPPAGIMIRRGSQLSPGAQALLRELRAAVAKLFA